MTSVQRDATICRQEKVMAKTHILLFFLLISFLNLRKTEYSFHSACKRALTCRQMATAVRSEQSAQPPSYLDSKVACTVFVYNAVFSKLSILLSMA